MYFSQRCPWQPNILASGGGTADRTIRIWNCNNGTLMNTVDTKSQVCSLVWANEYKELVSAHGYANNEVTIWKYPTMVIQSAWKYPLSTLSIIICKFSISQKKIMPHFFSSWKWLCNDQGTVRLFSITTLTLRKIWKKIPLMNFS